MRRAVRGVLVLLLIIFAFAGIYQGKDAKAADMKNVEEQDGILVNVSLAFHHSRYVNGYYFSDMIMYMEGGSTYFTMTVKNMASAARQEAEFDCLMYDEKYSELGSIGGRIAELEPGNSAQTVAVMSSPHSMVDAYDFALVFAEEDIIGPAKDAAVNRDILCDKNEVLEGEEVTLQSEEKGEYATYQWFYADGLEGAGIPVEGADKREYRIQGISLASSGKYYYCRIWKEDKVTDSKRTRLVVYDEKGYTESRGTLDGTSVKDIRAWQVKNLVAEQTDYLAAKLAWKKCNAESILVLRSRKKASGYQAVKKLKGGRRSYIDKTVKRGSTYYYKVVSFNGAVTEEIFQCKAKAIKVGIGYLVRPAIAVTKGIVGGQRYVQITLKEFEGEYIEICMGGKSGYHKLKMEKGKNRTSRRNYRFRYTKGNAQISFRARTYQKIGRKKYYSRFSRESQIKI